ncbi:uncharacterized protein LOC143184763 [Calliopsis andreniformis]|uniref:uncharacterized protein LOC143184763 n=1 Tax=Calliopsis andreniformis TaxID=337506 RepID=UPI003FCC2BE5
MGDSQSVKLGIRKNDLRDAHRTFSTSVSFCSFKLEKDQTRARYDFLEGEREEERRNIVWLAETSFSRKSRVTRNIELNLLAINMHDIMHCDDRGIASSQGNFLITYLL